MTTNNAENTAKHVTGFLWTAVRLPVLAMLLAFEPLVNVVFTLSCIALTLCALFFEYAVHAPHFPFRGMLAAAVCCACAMLCYSALIRLFSR